MVVVKIFQPAADHETGFSSRCMKHPTQKGRGGGFAVRPSHHQGFSAFQEKTGQRLRERCVVQSGFQHRLHFFVGFGNRVANNDQVNISRNIFLLVTRQNRNSRVFQKHTHRWIDMGIGPRHLVTLPFQQPGQGRHAGAADCYKVNVFNVFHRKEAL